MSHVAEVRSERENHRRERGGHVDCTPHVAIAEEEEEEEEEEEASHGRRRRRRRRRGKRSADNRNRHASALSPTRERLCCHGNWHQWILNVEEDQRSKLESSSLVIPPLPLPLIPLSNNSSIRFVYARRSNKVQSRCPSYFDTLLERFGSQFNAPSPQFETPDRQARALEDPAGKAVGLEEITAIGSKKQKRNSELLKLGVDSKLSLLDFSLPPWRRSSTVEGSGSVKATEKTRKRKASPRVHQDPDLLNAAASVSDDASLKTKKWVELSFEDVDPNTFVGLECKVFWPLDDDWYTGSVIGYDSEMHKHHVQYTDGDSESLILLKENIKFYLSREEMQQLNLRYGPSNKDGIGLDFGEMLVLAASCDDCDELEPGDIVWAKLTGYAVWPAVVLNESDIGVRKGLKPNQGERSVPVQFFGTYDFARINAKQAISFLKGLLASYHLKCKQSRFRRSLEDAKI